MRRFVVMGKENKYTLTTQKEVLELAVKDLKVDSKNFFDVIRAIDLESVRNTKNVISFTINGKKWTIDVVANMYSGWWKLSGPEECRVDFNRDSAILSFLETIKIVTDKSNSRTVKA